VTADEEVMIATIRSDDRRLSLGYRRELLASAVDHGDDSSWLS
jgi:hypothetical protein